MTFAIDRLLTLAQSGPVVRVVVAETRGSVPREVGASMAVTATSVEGTIGGGALEFEAIARAREVLQTGQSRVDRMPLGPALGQCCGGSVSLLTEFWTNKTLEALSREVIARPLPGTPHEMPLPVSRSLSDARAGRAIPSPGVVAGWMIEPVARPDREVWVWGAGHVGRAIVDVLSPLPDLHIRWCDSDRSRFPDTVAPGVEMLIAANPSDLVTIAPPRAEHLVLTYSHALDLDLCHRILSRPFRSLGLIGSQTKWARFRSRLAALGHAPSEIARIDCPIGNPALGKHPQAIAIGVAAEMIQARAGIATEEKRA